LCVLQTQLQTAHKSAIKCLQNHPKKRPQK
jgi:hypothetical protein